MELMDFDVVGIGGWSKIQLEKRLQGENVSLVIHKGMDWDHSLFTAALDRTLKWLRPENIHHIIWPKEKWYEKLHEAAWRIFPRTYERFGSQFDQDIEQYNREVPMEDWLLVEHYRHMPIYLKQIGRSKIQSEVARFDLMETLLKTRDMGELEAPGSMVELNPTLQVFDNHDGVLDFLKDKGLYLMLARPQTHEVVCEKITEDEALVLDLLAEDFVLTENQLLQLIDEHPWGSKKQTSEWRHLIHEVKIKGLLL